jgi:hypothetical protein
VIEALCRHAPRCTPGTRTRGREFDPYIAEVILAGVERLHSAIPQPLDQRCDFVVYLDYIAEWADEFDTWMFVHFEIIARPICRNYHPPHRPTELLRGRQRIGDQRALGTFFNYSD